MFKKLTLFKLLPFEEKVKIVGSAVFYQSDKLSFLNWMNSTHSMSNYIRLTKPGERLMMIENAFAQVNLCILVLVNEKHFNFLHQNQK